MLGCKGLKKMDSNQRSFDCYTNSTCEYLGKYIEVSVENLHVDVR